MSGMKCEGLEGGVRCEGQGDMQRTEREQQPSRSSNSQDRKQRNQPLRAQRQVSTALRRKASL